MSEMILGIIAGLANSITYASATVVYQSQIKKSNSFIANCIKTWAAVPLMIGAMIVLGSSSFSSVPISATFSFILSMFFGVILADTCYLAGQRRIGVSYALPISMTYPIFTNIIAVFLLWEPIIMSKLMGIIIAVLGVAVLSREQFSSGKDGIEIRSIDKFGLLLTILTAILTALSAILIQAGVNGVDPITGASIRIVSGFLVMLPLGLLAKTRNVQIPSRRPAAVLAIAGIVGMGFATFFWVIAIKYIGAIKASVLSATSSLFGVPVSIFVLGEKLTRKSGLSIAATIFGVILVLSGS
ncbi:MAG: DMT family transporter [Candidatus Thorarchaeota archaeon]|jgi:drug/metabolite transporter (DMT)-like permease